MTTNVSWEFLRRFDLRDIQAPSRWQPFEIMRKKADRALAPTYSRYRALHNRWERRLKDLGGDPSNCGWEDFRPLRLKREEDWSDWLAWLLEMSKTGTLAETLFAARMNCSASSLRRPEMEREVRCQGRRADIVLKWKTGEKSHIEVKVQDEHFSKTPDTADKLGTQHPGVHWHHFVLLPDEMVGFWEPSQTVGAISVILWSDVVRGLRRSLWEGREEPIWQAWAWTFCGAIERKLLGMRPPDPHRSNINQLQMTLSWLDILNFNKGEA